MHFALSFHKYRGLLSRMCTSQISSFPQSITDRTEMLHWHKINCSHLEVVRKTTGMYLPDREASLIKKEYCRLSASPHSLQVTPT